MIGLDTNVLVRYITQDDRVQSAVATRLIESRCNAESPGWIALAALCELVWVLQYSYAYEKAAIVSVLDHLLQSAELRIEQEDEAWAALAGYCKGTADFADYVILFRCRDAGATPIVTFDKRLARHSGAILATDAIDGPSNDPRTDADAG